MLSKLLCDHFLFKCAYAADRCAAVFGDVLHRYHFKLFAQKVVHKRAVKVGVCAYRADAVGKQHSDDRVCVDGFQSLEYNRVMGDYRVRTALYSFKDNVLGNVKSNKRLFYLRPAVANA